MKRKLRQSFGRYDVIAVIKKPDKAPIYLISDDHFFIKVVEPYARKKFKIQSPRRFRFDYLRSFLKYRTMEGYEIIEQKEFRTDLV
jgi:hypothetical protein